MMAYLFMIVAIFLALCFFGADVMTKLIGRGFDHVCECVRRAREEKNA